MSHPITLVCGVPGAGKTWVCQRLGDLYTWIQHDYFLPWVRPVPKGLEPRYVGALLQAAAVRRVITECPFGERLVIAQLEGQGLAVVPVYIVEPPAIVAARYFSRTGKPASKSILTRAARMREQAGANLAGTATEILAALRKL